MAGFGFGCLGVVMVDAKRLCLREVVVVEVAVPVFGFC